MTPETRGIAVEAIEYRLDSLINSIRKHRFAHYRKGDWRGDIHRRDAARDLRAMRSALRELKPRPWPAYYRTEPTVAWSRENR